MQSEADPAVKNVKQVTIWDTALLYALSRERKLTNTNCKREINFSGQVGHLSAEIENRAGHLVRAEREGAKEDQSDTAVSSLLRCISCTAWPSCSPCSGGIRELYSLDQQTAFGFTSSISDPHSMNRAGGGRRNRRVLSAQLTLRTLGAFRKKRPSEFKWRDKRERPGNPHEVRQGYFQAN
ncbi:hypothetical protein SRHO_G00093290 [Serrasalmus rhombeus]